MHRDIKPANILLDKRNRPKLGDFGLAQGSEREEGDTLNFGTLDYTAPEVLVDPKSADQKADTYALGVILYELLTAELPTKNYQAPSSLVKSSPQLDVVLSKCLHPNPDNRFAKASDFVEELKKARLRFKGGSKSFATPVGKTQQSNEGQALREPAVGFDFGLLRNLLIIVFLAGAIWMVWVALQKKQAGLAQSEEGGPRVESWKNNESVEPAPLLVSPKETKSSPGMSEPSGEELKPEKEAVAVAAAESAPLDELIELKRALKSGGRERFPRTTIQRGTSHFFFVDSPLMWYQAMAFAEEFGGHLAIAPRQEDLEALGTMMGSASKAWIGAGSFVEGAANSWTWFDGSMEFDEGLSRLSGDSAALVSQSGELGAAQASKRYPFFIEWRDGGSSQGDRRSQLARLEEGLSDAPLWPAGTLVWNDHRYLIVPCELTFEEAKAFAEPFQGYLASATSEEEAEFLQELVESSGLEKLWLGGQQEDSTWRWLTEEEWNSTSWAEGFPTSAGSESALLLTPGGWESQSSDLVASGMILEWFEVVPQKSVEELTQQSAAIQELVELQEKAKRMLLEESREALVNNYEGQEMAVRQWLRSIGEKEQRAFEKTYEKYTEFVDLATGRLPSPHRLEFSSGSHSKEVREGILRRHFVAQKDVDQKWIASAETFRVHYVRRLEAMMAELESQGTKEELSFVQQELEGVGEGGIGFLSYLKILPETSAVFHKLEIVSAFYGFRQKREDVTELIREKLVAGESFRSNRDSMGFDPSPGWNKSIVFEYRINGEAGKKEWWSRALIFDEVILKYHFDNRKK